MAAVAIVADEACLVQTLFTADGSSSALINTLTGELVPLPGHFHISFASEGSGFVSADDDTQDATWVDQFLKLNAWRSGGDIYIADENGNQQWQDVLLSSHSFKTLTLQRGPQLGGLAILTYRFGTWHGSAGTRFALQVRDLVPSLELGDRSTEYQVSWVSTNWSSWQQFLEESRFQPSLHMIRNIESSKRQQQHGNPVVQQRAALPEYTISSLAMMALCCRWAVTLNKSSQLAAVTLLGLFLRHILSAGTSYMFLQASADFSSTCIWPSSLKDSKMRLMVVDGIASVAGFADFAPELMQGLRRTVTLNICL